MNVQQAKDIRHAAIDAKLAKVYTKIQEAAVQTLSEVTLTPVDIDPLLLKQFLQAKGFSVVVNQTTVTIRW